MLLSRKYRVVAAVRVDEKNIDDAIVVAEQYIATHVFLERRLVLLCENDISSELCKCGYEIYIKQTEEK